MLAAFARLSGRFLLAVLVTTLIGTLIQTQINLAALSNIGVDIGWSARLDATGADLLGFTPSFGPIVAIGFLVAFLIAALIARWWPQGKPVLYPLAGFVAILTAMLLMAAIFKLTPVAAARSTLGLLALALSGAAGGLLFVCTRPRTETPSTG